MKIFFSIFLLHIYIFAGEPPFKIGELLRYSADWNGIKVGEAELFVSGMEKINGFDSYKITFTTQTKGFANRIFPIKDQIDVWIDKKTNELIIVDYKSTAKNDLDEKKWINDKYTRDFLKQINFYTYLFKQAGFSIKTTFFYIVNALKKNRTFNNNMKFQSILIEYQPDTKHIEKQLKEYLEKITDEALYAYNVYQIEGEGRNLFISIEGDENTIMGLPIIDIKNYLSNYK